MLRCALVGLLGFWVLPVGVSAADPLPNDAQALMDAHEKQVEEIQAAVEKQLQALRAKTMEGLQALQDRYTREAKLDEAVAVRDQIRALKRGMDSANVTVLPSPGRLYEYRELLNQHLYFQLTGEVGGSVWGTDIYTGDSSLAAAAVHAGAVEVGQTAVVKVTMLPGLDGYAGTMRAGVTSSSYGTYPYSFKVERTKIPVRPLPMPAPQPAVFDRLGGFSGSLVPQEFDGLRVPGRTLTDPRR